MIDFWKNEWNATTGTEELFASPDPQNGDGSSSIKKRPKWADVYRGYPKNSSETDDRLADSVFKSIRGDNYEKHIFTNACATRVSLGLLEGEMNVKRDFLIIVGKFSGKGFIASAINLKEWLSQSNVWGECDEFIKGSSTLEDVQNTILGRNGVYIILGGFAEGVSGHATLWIGAENNVIGGHNYLDYGGDVYFWELK